MEQESIQEIQKKFNKVLLYSQKYLFNDDSLPHTDNLFQLWNEQKAELKKFLGNKLIYKTPEPITLELTDEEKEKVKAKFISSLDAYYFGYDKYSDIREFLYQYVDFFNNVVSKEYTTINGDTIPVGMKMIKAFKYFTEDSSILRAIQDRASEDIQKNKVCGKLCFSIHPLDYLSMSETAYNWRSCHALDGEYRCGTLSYMCDPTTIICYIEGERKQKLPRFPEDVLWNSKKWRMTLHIYQRNKKFLIAGRQYPFFTYDALNIVKQQFEKLCHEEVEANSDEWVQASVGSYGEWDRDEYSQVQTYNGIQNFYTPCRYIGGLMLPLKSIVKKKKHYLHYDDVNMSHIYNPHILQNTAYAATIIPKIDIGCDKVPCIKCGKETIQRHEDMCCEECYQHTGAFHICAACGTPLTEDEIIYSDDGEPYCSSCYNETYTTCYECGAEVLIDDATYIDGRWLCSECAEEYINE